ncbi:MAG: hypothetical protein KGZ61_09020 [Sandarakinorhabdus sp.]|nr:hypothetical protein [Sandarakinorhabdus sp.]
MTLEMVGTVRSTLKSTDHPYMQGAWQPTFNEWNAIFANGGAEVIGTILRTDIPRTGSPRTGSAGPVCRIILPERFCSGTHSVWANGDDIGMPPNSVVAA